ncbi:creatininase family protein [Streptomyces canarius]
MRVAEMNWMQIEAQAKRDDRCVLPLGGVERHPVRPHHRRHPVRAGGAEEAAEPLGIAVFPVLAYGLTPGFLNFPGSISLKMSTYAALLGDIFDGFYRSGFRRIVLVNGHGGDSPALKLATEWLDRHPDASIRLHNWWAAPMSAAVKAVDPAASHASSMENTLDRLAGRRHARHAEAAWRNTADPRPRARRSATKFSVTAISMASTGGPTRRC